MVFDLLRLDGEDLTGLPLARSAARGSRGSALDGSTGRCRRRTTTATMLFEATLAQGLEGVVSKRRSSTYTLRPAHRRTG